MFCLGVLVNLSNKKGTNIKVPDYAAECHHRANAHTFTYLAAELVNLLTTRVRARFSALNLSFSAFSFCNCYKTNTNIITCYNTEAAILSPSWCPPTAPCLAQQKAVKSYYYICRNIAPSFLSSVVYVF